MLVDLTGEGGMEQTGCSMGLSGWSLVCWCFPLPSWVSGDRPLGLSKGAVYVCTGVSTYGLCVHVCTECFHIWVCYGQLP